MQAGSILVFIDILEKSAGETDEKEAEEEEEEEEEVSYATFGPPQPLIRRP